MTADEAYEGVATELARDEVKPGLMVKSVAEAEGDERRVMALYIRYRAEQLLACTGTPERSSTSKSSEHAGNNVTSCATRLDRHNPMAMLVALAWLLLALGLAYVTFISFGWPLLIR
jgi:hypothetical protein